MPGSRVTDVPKDNAQPSRKKSQKIKRVKFNFKQFKQTQTETGAVDYWQVDVIGEPYIVLQGHTHCRWDRQPYSVLRRRTHTIGVIDNHTMCYKDTHCRCDRQPYSVLHGHTHTHCRCDRQPYSVLKGHTHTVGVIENHTICYKDTHTYTVGVIDNHTVRYKDTLTL